MQHLSVPLRVPVGLGCGGLANQYCRGLSRIPSETGATGFQFTFTRREWAVVSKLQSLQRAAECILHEPGEGGVWRPIDGIAELVDL